MDADGRDRVFRPSGPGPFSWATERTPGATAVLFLTIRTGRLAELLHQRALRPHQLDGAQLAVLVALTSAGEDGAMSPSDLSALLAQTPSGITRTVKRLERERLVARETDPGDGRSFLLRITDAGTATMGRAMTDLLDQFDEQIESMGGADLLPLVGTLQEVADLFEHLPDRTPVSVTEVAPSPNSHADEAIGARIRRERTERGITQRQLAERAAIGAPHLSKLERGTEQPSEALLVRIADALAIDRDELLLQAGLVPRWMVEALAADPARTVRALRRWSDDG